MSKKVAEKELHQQLMQAILSFVNDPPGSDFQRGYLAALIWVQEIWATAYNDNEAR